MPTKNPCDEELVGGIVEVGRIKGTELGSVIPAAPVNVQIASQISPSFDRGGSNEQGGSNERGGATVQ